MDDQVRYYTAKLQYEIDPTAEATSPAPSTSHIER